MTRVPAWPLIFVDVPKTVLNRETYDDLMVVVCRLIGYVLAIPTQKLGLDRCKLAENL